MGDPVYLDANASEVLRPEAAAAVLAALSLPGNPSSVHGAGRQARSLLERSRERIAACFDADPAGLVFTSGGTEANALAIHAHAAGPVLIGATEHDAIRAAAPGAGFVPVHRDGTIDFDALERALQAARPGPPALLCLMLANNETGVLHDVAAAAVLCRAHGARLHVDAVQAAGRIAFTVASLGAHSVALSAHKLGGPKGAGALLLSPDALHLAPMMPGGGQERGRRGGTPALPAIAGFAAACEVACRELDRQPDLARLRDRIERAAVDAGAVVMGAGAPRLANTTCLALPGRRAETQLIALDLAGYAVSAGAACSSGKVARSHVLEAMGLSDLAGSAIRVSLPWNAEDTAIDRFVDAYLAMAARLPAAMRAA